MKDLEIGREIYIYFHQNHEKSNCLETKVVLNFLHKLPKYSDITYSFLYPQN